MYQWEICSVEWKSPSCSAAVFNLSFQSGRSSNRYVTPIVDVWQEMLAVLFLYLYLMQFLGYASASYRSSEKKIISVSISRIDLR